MSWIAQDGHSASLFPDDPFTGFGPSLFFPAEAVPGGRRVAGRKVSVFHADVRTAAPRRPGVYAMLDARGRVIYVGKAKNLRARLLSYFRTGSRDPKAGRILRHTRTLLWELAADEFAALLRELELIRRFRPRFNVVGQPENEMYVYLCIGRAPAPYVYLTREPRGKEIAVYGPFRGKGGISGAVRRVNMHFGLRDCPSTTVLSFADQSVLFEGERTAQCMRHELGTCLGPCAGFCDQRKYTAAVRGARAFLDGRDPRILSTLTKEMLAASAAMNYERAAVLRDQLDSLTKLTDRLTFLRSIRNSTSFIYPLTGPSGVVHWYLIHGGQVRAVVHEPVCATTATQAMDAVREVFVADGPGVGVLDRCVDSVLIVSRWFRKREGEKARLLSASVAIEQCRKIKATRR